jgi:serine/threonine protein kinase/Tol biopolymer transport system component
MHPPPSSLGASPSPYSAGTSTERLALSLADRYRIERQLGQGGMATVYLASDLKHDRKVALKVLKPELSAVLGADRFVVEIKTTAGLQHPHILPLFDSGSAEGLLYYVMPYVEGETLRTKLNRETQFGVEEAVRIARDVADALDYAHRHGVVHRDIKPENILLHDGRPVVADFGIALAVSAAAGGRMTETGLSLGTPHYMSPEQATADKDITARSDVYSLGSVLYEMLTGNPPHTGASAQQIIMKIITDQAEPVTKFRKSVPPHVAAAVAKSLEKLPADRFESARLFGEALANPTFSTATAAGAAPHDRPQQRTVFTTPFLAAASVAVVASIGAVWGWARPEPPREVSRFSLLLPDSQQLNPGVNATRLAVSPDGRTIVYVGGGAGPASNRLWVRRMDELRAVPLAGTERPANPAFSPDGKRIAFVNTQVPRTIRVVPLAGGPVQTLTDSLVDLGGLAWASDGYIYYDGHLEGDGIARIRATGGEPEIVSRPDAQAGENYHFMPSALPDDRQMLMSIARPAGGGSTDIALLDTRTGKHRVLTRGVVGRYAATGHLVYATDDGLLMAAPFDLKRGAITGDAVLLTEGLAFRGNQRVDVALSSAGVLAYSSGATVASVRELVWVSREGIATVVDPTWTADLSGRAVLSPDGRAAAITIGRGNSRQVWVKQLDRGPASRVTDAGWAPSWTPDGRSLVFSSPSGLQRVPADGSSLPVTIRGRGSELVAPVTAAQASYSPDGKWLVFQSRGDVMAVRTDGDTSTRVMIADVANQMVPMLSPDGRWIAYSSDESGTFQVYVRPFPDTKVAKRQVSLASGYAPRWSRSGRELFYFDGNQDLWVVPVSTTPSFTSGLPKRLFALNAYAPITNNLYDVGADGQRFLFSRAAGSGGDAPDELVIVLNFFEELKATVATKP